MMPLVLLKISVLLGVLQLLGSLLEPLRFIFFQVCLDVGNADLGTEGTNLSLVKCLPVPRISLLQLILFVGCKAYADLLLLHHLANLFIIHLSSQN